MTEDDITIIWSRKQLLHNQIHKLVDQLTEDLTEEQDHHLRLQLTEEFLFWRNT